MRKFRRKYEDEMIAGVCTGIAEYIDVDVSIIRLAFILGTIFISGWGIMIYLLAALVVPKE